MKELLEKLKAAKAKAQIIIDAADKDSDGVMSEDQQKEFDAAVADAQKYSAQIEQRKSLDAINEPSVEGTGRASSPSQPAANTPRIEPGADNINPTGGYDNLGDFAASVRTACHSSGIVDDRLVNILGAPTNFHQEAGTQEGYQIPAQFRSEIWKIIFSDDVNLLNMIDMEPTNSNSVDLLADETTPWGSTGIQAKWRNEGTQMTPTKLETDPRQVKLHELYAFATAGDELLEDSPRLSNRLMVKAPEAIKWKMVEAIVNGTGAGQPLGYMNSGALVTVAKETSQVAATIVAANVAKMFSRLLPGGLARAVWLINSDAIPQLITMVIGNVPIYTPPNAGISQSPGGFLFGRPIVLSEHADTLGTVGDIQLIDPKGYYGANKRNSIKFDTSIHLFFDYGLQAFRWTVRLGGQPHLSAPVSPAKGANTKSHFVSLATRA